MKQVSLATTGFELATNVTRKRDLQVQLANKVFWSLNRRLEIVFTLISAPIKTLFTYLVIDNALVPSLPMICEAVRR